MDDKYNPGNIETRHYERWRKNNWFAPAESGEPYSIMIPPPNVTGTLHMGHAFQDTIMDALTRYHRMSGQAALWQVGMDHAGIATQMVVERQLNAEGKTRHDLGRDGFVDRVWRWKEESGGLISEQLQRMGGSVDWEHERFTMDDDLSAAVTKVFVELYREGLIYRGKRLVNWDPVLHTALSDLEVLSEEEDGSLWHFRYPLADGTGDVVVATTRPETMLGDTAVAVHPDDERFRQLVGKKVRLPLADRLIPIVADDYVDPEFGTGCVKITPAHDFNDYELGLRHQLPMINVLDDNACMNEAVPRQYQGLDRFVARKRVIADLDELGHLDRIEDHRLTVPRGDRSQAIVEPYLTDQWYVKIEPLARPAIEAVETGKIRFVPENWSKTYFDWMHNIQDWCISRQLWWGHRIPAWYDDDGNIYVGEDLEAVRKEYNIDATLPLSQDPDVLDTWFSSALWPFSTLGWPAQTTRLQRFYPTNILVTGFDIIFFWVARMIMMGLKFTGEVPFREVYIHGLIRDPDGQKMSKSKGNVLDPLDLIDGIGLEALVEKRKQGLMQPHLAPRIEKATRKQFPKGIQEFGCDALRFTFASLATTGRDIRFDLGRIEGYQHFCNKLWNAARYVLLSTADVTAGPVTYGAPELWIRSRLARTVAEVRQQFDSYRFDLAAKAIYEFTWHEFCDWYLEFSKASLQSYTDDADARRGTERTLLEVLETTLRLMHPLMPFITEEIWLDVNKRQGRSGETIMLAPYPAADDAALNAQAEAEIEWIMHFVLGVRQIRGEMNISPGKPVRVLLQDATEQDLALLEPQRSLLEKIGRIESVGVIDAMTEPPPSATALLGSMKILVPLAGLIDTEAELARLEKLQSNAARDLERVEAKLGNEKFVQNAPPDVVDKERARLADLKLQMMQLKAQIEKLSSEF